jgi:putative flippase GtrA
MTPVRYIAVQVLAYLIDVGVYSGALATGATPAVANLLSKAAAGGLAFHLHRRFTFRVHDSDGHVRGQAIRYVVLLGVNAVLTSVLLTLLTAVLEHALLSKVVADVVVVVGTYLASKWLVFSKRMDQRV